MVKVACHGSSLYLDDHLKGQLDKIKKNVMEKDEDRFYVVDGREGTGKSVFTLQLACYLDSSFSMDRVVFTAEDFEKAIIRADKGQVVVFDEAFRGLSSRASLSAMNKMLVQLMMECRQKNLIVFIVMPTFFLLETYVALFRASGLFHIYRGEGHKRGFWMYFNYRKKKMLYMIGKKKFWDYDSPKANFIGRFTNKYLIDEPAYREKKRLAFEKSVVEKETKRDKQRNVLLKYIIDKYEVPQSTLLAELKPLGFSMSGAQLSRILQNEREI